MNNQSMEFLRRRDIEPFSGFLPMIEAWGRKRRLTAGIIIAEHMGIQIEEDVSAKTAQLLNIYWNVAEQGGYVNQQQELVKISLREVEKLALQRIHDSISTTRRDA